MYTNHGSDRIVEPNCSQESLTSISQVHKMMSRFYPISLNV